MTPPAFTALAPAPFVTIQDMGRRGWSRFGVSGAGAMDPYALAAANALVGNPAHLAAIEFAYGCGVWRVDAESCRMAVAGGAFRILVDDRLVPPWSSFRTHRGETVRVDGAADAIWGYLAVERGFALAPWLGSHSTHLRSGLGGMNGRVLRAEDRVPLTTAEASDAPDRSLPHAPTPEETVVRAVLGPQDDCFTAEAVHALFTEEFAVTVQCDRLGYCLQGAPLPHLEGPDITSDGVVPGSIQVPGSRQPIVLMRDCQPPGGYAKIATVISCDVARVAQTRPGCSIRFRQVGVAEAQLIRGRYLDELASLPERAIPRRED